MSPVPDQDDPAKQPKTGRATNAASATSTASGASADETDAARTARHQEEDAKAADKTARRKSHMEGLMVAHDNLGKEIDAMIGQLAQGNQITASQLQALKASVKGIHETAGKIADGKLDPNAPETAGTAGTQNP